MRNLGKRISAWSFLRGVKLIIDTIKTRYQTQYMASHDEIKPLVAGEKRYNSTWHCVKETFRQEGIVGMYRGMGITMARAFIGTIFL